MQYFFFLHADNPQIPPSQCVANFKIDQDGEMIFIKPGVANCFICAIGDLGNVGWKVQSLVTSALVPVQRTEAHDGLLDVFGNVLIISVPETYVLPGISASRNVQCIRSDDGFVALSQHSALLASPSKIKSYNASDIIAIIDI